MPPEPEQDRNKIRTFLQEMEQIDLGVVSYPLDLTVKI